MEEMLHTRERRPGMMKIIWLFVLYLIDSLIDFVGDNVRVMRREFEVFLGSALALTGLLGFESDKFCDGNTADYLSCTRPSTYYYFDTLDIILVVLGALLVIAWYLKRNPRS